MLTGMQGLAPGKGEEQKTETECVHWEGQCVPSELPHAGDVL